MKTVFTTGEAAKICKVSQQTIIRCFDNGQLKGFRVPGSRFRRIPRESLYKFMKELEVPIKENTKFRFKEPIDAFDDKGNIKVYTPEDLKKTQRQQP